MICHLCGGKGIIRIGYREPPTDGYVDYGICTCGKGQRFRTANARLMLAAKFGVSQEQINLIEDVLDAEDLAGTVITTTADVTDAGRKHGKAKL